MGRGYPCVSPGQNQQLIWIPSRHLKPCHEPDAEEEILEGTQGPPSCSHVKIDNKEDTSSGSNTHWAQPPMWSQIKKLTQMAEENLKEAGRRVTMSNLMAAMMAVLTIASADVDPESCEK
ncbi:endogenous retrovirus group K member 19 Rec protein-like [Hylobates moloch]|uniref:endogenous retrovirus group K member 19 Rec protein-like n=1 Tax=Hylobates moloch TaxID=81572 RepID=UPI001362EB9D|nr:endogenous retrovirus group K member 19 Rec protein-like [Hylobates moloch]